MMIMRLYFFLITLLLLFAIPSTWFAIRIALRAFGILKKSETAVRTIVEKRKANELAEEESAKKVLCKTGYLINLGLLFVAWTSLIYLIYRVTVDSELARFDPFAILGVASNADTSTIRKAYRQLSLKYHPDKNPGNKIAEEMFMKVAKAYEALTDPESKENYEKFGNPDGKQALEISIGLPTFLLDENNHYAILIIYLGILVFIIPGIVAAWYAHSQKFGENNVKYETYSFFLHALSENCTTKMLPEVLAGAAEHRRSSSSRIAKSSSSTSSMVLRDLSQKLKAQMHKPRFEHQIIVEHCILLHAHLTRTKINDPILSKHTSSMLRNSMRLCEAMLDLSQSHRWLQTSLNIIDFMQHLTQATWLKDHELLQLPHFGPTEIGHATKGKHGAKGLLDYIKMPDDQKKGLGDLSDDQVKDVLTVCNTIIPQIEATFTLFVEDETEIAEGDLVSLSVKMTRTNLQAPGQQAPPVHAPYFPAQKLESWWILISSKDGPLILAEKISNRNRKLEHRVKFVAPPRAGKYAFVVDLKSADYIGLDIRSHVTMTVVPAAQLPEYKPHQEDLELDDEPTLFEQVMSANVDDSSDDDDDDDDDDTNKKGGNISVGDDDDDFDAPNESLSEAERRRRQAKRLKQRRKIKDSSSD